MAIVLATVSLTATSSADGPRPGLPRHAGAGAWLSVAQGGASKVTRAEQWARVPMQVSTVFNVTEPIPLPPGDPRQQHRLATNWIYLMAEEGAAHPYGLSAPFSVHTVAFGTIPVTATLRLAQRRAPSGLPVPLMVYAYDDFYSPPPPGWRAGLRIHDTDVTDRLELQVESITIDGHDLEITDDCRTREPARLTLHGNGFINGSPEVNDDALWESGHFAPGRGGLLSGTVDVPAFVDCRTPNGEDVSALLTATASGPDNAVTLHASGPSTACGSATPPHPGEYDAALECPAWIPGEVTLPPQQQPN